MKFLIDNWSLLVIIFAACTLAWFKFKKLSELPDQAQQQKIKEYLLYAVIMAEKEFQNGTGQLKLRYVWSLFLDKFPSVAPVVSFEVFSSWVDEVLVQMKSLLETNIDIAAYVNIEDKKDES